jgi:osmotically-inducible protein OsmY
MNWNCLGMIVLLATVAPVAGAAQVEPPPLAPPSGIDREENNPAKAASKAKEAQQKDEQQDAALGASAAALTQRVEVALLRDAATAKLGIQVSVDENQIIELRGTVPSTAGRVAAERVATAVDGATRIRNLVEVRK